MEREIDTLYALRADYSDLTIQANKDKYDALTKGIRALERIETGDCVSRLTMAKALYNIDDGTNMDIYTDQMADSGIYHYTIVKGWDEIDFGEAESEDKG